MNLKACIAEFIGTFTLIFVGVCAINTSGDSRVAVALAHGLAIAVMVSATAAISGGHLNPAVTVGAWVSKHITPVNAAGYIGSQCLGAIAGAVLAGAALPHGFEAGTIAL